MVAGKNVNGRNALRRDTPLVVTGLIYNQGIAGN